MERSVRNGRLEPLEAYRTGPSAHRPEGATNIPRRNHRLPYTLQDDQLLWDYMQKFERDESAMINGRRIYQEFADMVSKPCSFDCFEAGFLQSFTVFSIRGTLTSLIEIIT